MFSGQIISVHNHTVARVPEIVKTEFEKNSSWTRCEVNHTHTERNAQTQKCVRRVHATLSYIWILEGNSGVLDIQHVLSTTT